jgi:hypothetical protein
MGLRNFTDSAGSDWRVWDVTPYTTYATERRATDRRVSGDAAYIGPERRAGRERRVRTPRLMTPGLETGWLCFESEREKRRLTPIPSGWEACAPDELEDLVRQAQPVTRRPEAN